MSLLRLVSGEKDPVKITAAINQIAEAFDRSTTANRQLVRPLILYVNPSTGSDANDGLTSAAALATIAQAITLLQKHYDIQGGSPAIQLADGTYSTAVNFQSTLTGGFLYSLSGAAGHGSSVIFTAGVSCKDYAAVTLSEMTFSGVAGDCVSADQFGVVDINSTVTFGACPSANHIHAANGGSINLDGGYTIGGGAVTHLYTTNGGRINVDPGGIAVPITSAGFNFSDSFARGETEGILNIAHMTFTGLGAGTATTGTRFKLLSNAIINNGGATDPNTTLPGNAAGTTQMGQGDGDAGAVWTTYTPTISSSGGTLTSASATGRYRQIGKIVFVQIIGSITTNGTGSGRIDLSLPVTAANSTYVMIGLETTATNHQLNGAINGSSRSILNVRFYDASYPGADGATLVMNGTYESA